MDSYKSFIDEILRPIIIDQSKLDRSVNSTNYVEKLQKLLSSDGSDADPALTPVAMAI